jgi:protein TonB
VSAPFTAELGTLPTVPEKRVYEEVFKVVEDMPRFYHPDCETLRTKAERKECAAEAMLDVIYSNLEYPVEPRVLGIEETVVVSFWVEETGQLTHINAVRGKREDFKAEAVRLVEEYLRYGWVPGKQRGKPVVVQFNLPIKFELNK